MFLWYLQKQLSQQAASEDQDIPPDTPTTPLSPGMAGHGTQSAILENGGDGPVSSEQPTGQLQY